MERLSHPGLRRVLVRAAVVSFLCVAVRTDAHGQELDFVKGLFKDVHSVTLFASFAEIRKSPQLGTQSSQCLLLGVCGGGAEVLWDLTPPERKAHLELGFSASYLRGFSGKPLPDPFDLRASVRSFPEFGAYLSTTVSKLELLAPYIGGNFGFSDLWNAQVYGADGKQTSIKGQTFDYGVVVGMAFNATWGGNAFIEGAYRGRRFPSLEYGTKESLPATWPRELDFSGWQFALGWQFELKPPKKPPPFGGVWILSTVDADALPATLVQSRNPDGTSTRIEIQGGTLHLSRKTWALRLQQKTTTLDTQLRVIDVRVVDLPPEQGVYRIVDAGLIMTRGAGSGAGETIERVGDEIVLRQARPGHRLLFKKL